jgi:hypothetical protein
MIIFEKQSKNESSERENMKMNKKVSFKYPRPPFMAALQAEPNSSETTLDFTPASRRSLASSFDNGFEDDNEQVHIVYLFADVLVKILEG